MSDVFGAKRSPRAKETTAGTALFKNLEGVHVRPVDRTPHAPLCPALSRLDHRARHAHVGAAADDTLAGEVLEALRRGLALVLQAARRAQNSHARRPRHLDLREGVLLLYRYTSISISSSSSSSEVEMEDTRRWPLQISLPIQRDAAGQMFFSRRAVLCGLQAAASALGSLPLFVMHIVLRYLLLSHSICCSLENWESFSYKAI